MSVGTSLAPEAIVGALDAAAERRETPCGDGTMAWRAWGRGTPVVLFHGAHGSWTHWIRTIDALRARHRVLAPDLPGHGESALPPRTDDVGAMAGVIVDGLRRLPETGPFALLGFSMGGVVAAHVAAQAPDLAERLVVVDAGGLGTPPGHFVSTPVRGLEGAALMAAHRANLLALMLHGPDAVDALALHVQAANVPRTRIQPRPLVMPDRRLVALPEIRCQVDLIWGEHDAPHPDPERQAAVVRQFHPDASLDVLAGAGHWAMYERADAFNEAALRLLAAPRRR
jgi:pimeloyl-ACP methyl ester carboxylesterase